MCNLSIIKSSFLFKKTLASVSLAFFIYTLETLFSCVKCK